MNSLERVTTALEYKEPDRVPVFHSFTLHGARELGIPIKEYFSKPEHVVLGQLRLMEKYQNDCVVGVLYTAREMEAWGQETIFYDNGPPNAGTPIISRPEDILSLDPPRVADSKALIQALEVISGLYNKVGAQTPILAAVISPFSTPIMQMGFGEYLDLLHERPELVDRLLKINEEFCVEWANAQLKAGATAIAYYDPMLSPTLTTTKLLKNWGLPTARRVFSRIDGSVGAHTASGRILPIIKELMDAGSAMFGISAEEDLAEAKSVCQKRAAIMGNLNAIEMARWTETEAAEKVKKAIAKGGPGGGFILTDNHGEIPWQVPENIIMAIVEAVRKWGEYPLTWTEEYAS